MKAAGGLALQETGPSPVSQITFQGFVLVSSLIGTYEMSNAKCLLVILWNAEAIEISPL